MECRRFRITLLSAEDLPAVQNSGKTKVFAKVSVAGKRKSEKQTPVDTNNEINPRWNYTISYKVAEELIQQEHVKLSIKVYCKNNKARDTYFGEVNLPLKSLFCNGMTAEKVSYAIENINDASFSKGTIQISYSFGEKIRVKNISGWKRAMDSGGRMLLEATCFVAFGFVVEEDNHDRDILVKP